MALRITVNEKKTTYLLNYVNYFKSMAPQQQTLHHITIMLCRSFDTLNNPKAFVYVLHSKQSHAVINLVAMMKLNKLMRSSLNMYMPNANANT